MARWKFTHSVPIKLGKYDVLFVCFGETNTLKTHNRLDLVQEMCLSQQATKMGKAESILSQITRRSLSLHNNDFTDNE